MLCMLHIYNYTPSDLKFEIILVCGCGDGYEVSYPIPAHLKKPLIISVNGLGLGPYHKVTKLTVHFPNTDHYSNECCLFLYRKKSYSKKAL